MTSRIMLSMLWMQKMSRVFTDFPKGNKDWTSIETMEQAFFKNFPTHKEPYKKAKKEKAKYWGDLFVPDFQKVFLYNYLADNFPRPTPDMV